MFTKTPQSQPFRRYGAIRLSHVPQVENDAGGYVWKIDKWAALERFLILGTEGGTYYVKEREHTERAATNVLACLEEDGLRVVREVVRISTSRQAAKNDPALFVLALAIAHQDVDVRRAAGDALPAVARIGTHLFHFAAYVKGHRGWGRVMRRAVADWYNKKPAPALGYQVAKYQQRDGWSHRDMLRLAKPVPVDRAHDAIYAWVVGKPVSGHDATQLPFLLTTLADTPDAGTIIDYIDRYNISWEMIPTRFLKDNDVWRAMLRKDTMPITALVRNLGRLTAIGALRPWDDLTQKVAVSMSSRVREGTATLHPMTILNALHTYNEGKGVRGSLTWEPLGVILEQLDHALEYSFDQVKPTGKKILLAVDVSSSMDWRHIQGMAITPRLAAAALALATVKSEASSDVHCMAFAEQFRPFPISKSSNFVEVIHRMRAMPFGGTDCAQPMLWASNNKADVDAFVIYTDSETWAGDVHPAAALWAYRKRMNKPHAKLVVVAMQANDVSIAHPEDAGMLDIVGMSTATPQLIAEFIKDAP